MGTQIAKLQSAVGLVQTPDRSGLHERFYLRPGINADIGDTKNKAFEVKGTNGTSALATHPATSIAGVTLTTAGASADQMLLAPHEDAGVSPIEAASFLPSAAPGFYCQLKTGASIAAATIFAGLKLTETPVVATDDDQVFWRYQDSQNSGKWQIIISIGGSDLTVNTDLEVAASTYYELFISIGSDRKPVFGYRANGEYQSAVHVGDTALTAAAALKPVAGIQAGAAAAKAVTITDIAAARANA